MLNKRLTNTVNKHKMKQHRSVTRTPAASKTEFFVKLVSN